MAPDDLRAFGHRARMKQMGYSQKDWEGKPIIAILNTWSDLNTCHSHFKDRAQAERLGKNPDFNSLARRPEFQGFLAELAKRPPAGGQGP